MPRESRKKQAGSKDEKGERDGRTPSSGLPARTGFRIQDIHFHSAHKSHVTCSYLKRLLHLAREHALRLGRPGQCISLSSTLSLNTTGPPQALSFTHSAISASSFLSHQLLVNGRPLERASGTRCQLRFEKKPKPSGWEFPRLSTLMPWL